LARQRRPPFVECKSWVWKYTTNECFLKNEYSAQEDIECPDCVAHSANSNYYLYSWSMFRLGSKITWTHDGGIWMPQPIAARVCRVSIGHDQPEKYNLLARPMILDFSYQCCNACARMEGECKSFVFKTTTHECFLKSAYVPEENTIDCKDCISYDESSTSYVFEKPATVVRQIQWKAGDWSSMTQSSFGARGAWRRVSSSKLATCRFDTGFDQSNDYDIKAAVLVDAAYKCCYLCQSEESKTFH